MRQRYVSGESEWRCTLAVYDIAAIVASIVKWAFQVVVSEYSIRSPEADFIGVHQ